MNLTCIFYYALPRYVIFEVLPLQILEVRPFLTDGVVSIINYNYVMQRLHVKAMTLSCDIQQIPLSRSINYTIFLHTLQVEFWTKKTSFAGSFFLFCFYWKKSAAAALRILVEVYGEHASSIPNRKEWFVRSKNRNFDVEDKEHSGKPKKIRNWKIVSVTRLRSWLRSMSNA